MADYIPGQYEEEYFQETYPELLPQGDPTTGIYYDPGAWGETSLAMPSLDPYYREEETDLPVIGPSGWVPQDAPTYQPPPGAIPSGFSLLGVTQYTPPPAAPAIGGTMSTSLTPAGGQITEASIGASIPIILALVARGAIPAAVAIAKTLLGKSWVKWLLSAAAAGLISYGVVQLLQRQGKKRRKRYSIGSNPRLGTLIKVGRHVGRVYDRYDKSVNTFRRGIKGPTARRRATPRSPRSGQQIISVD